MAAKKQTDDLTARMEKDKADMKQKEKAEKKARKKAQRKAEKKEQRAAEKAEADSIRADILASLASTNAKILEMQKGGISAEPQLRKPQVGLAGETISVEAALKLTQRQA